MSRRLNPLSHSNNRRVYALLTPIVIAVICCALPALIIRLAAAMSAGRVLVYGGKGALGATVVDHFKKANYYVISLDLHANDAADASVTIDPAQSWTEQEKSILEKVAPLASSPLDAIFCVAGGWAGGNAASDDFIKNADLMFKQSVISSTIAARLAAKHLKPGGLLQLTGAAAALEGTPGMIGYGMAKAAVQQLTKSLAANDSGMPADSTVVAILPVTLDTPMNRKWMPKADFGAWTSMGWLSEQFLSWTSTPSARPASGQLLKMVTQGGNTTITTY